jgi:hypothetical protein
VLRQRVEGSVSNLSYPGDVNLACVGWILRDSKKDILDGRDDLERHQRWLNRHRMASADDLARHKQRLNRRCEFSAFKRMVISRIGFVASACIALRQGTTWIFASLFDLLSISLSRTRVVYVLGLQPKETQALGFAPTIHQASATGHSRQTLIRGPKDFPKPPLVAEVAKFRTARFSRFVIPNLLGRRVPISIFGLMAVALLAVGAFGTTPIGPSAQVTLVLQSSTGATRLTTRATACSNFRL